MARPSEAELDEALAPLLLKLRARDQISDEEARVLRGAISEIRDLPNGKTIVRAGVPLSESILLIRGFVCRFRDLSDGQRQIMELHVPGDFLDLHGFLLKELEHDVGAMTPVRFAAVPHELLRGITENHPHLARMMWFSTLLDAAIHREKILTVGRRSAIAGIAHLLCELFVRLGIIGLTEGESYALPLTQADLADAAGLTPVHVNRMLKTLREDGLLTFRGGRVTIHDWERLARMAEFDPRYLFLDRRPR